MELIDMARLERDEHALAEAFQTARPFRYLVIDDFLHAEQAVRIMAEYLVIDADWASANGLHTRGKWAKPTVAGSVAEAFYRESTRPHSAVILAG